VDIVVTGRHVDVPNRVRAYTLEKLAKVDRLCPKAIRVDVEFSREANPRMSEICKRVQLTCVSRGPAIRAEAAADDMIAAVDLAWAKLEMRLRRSADRRRVHRGVRTPVSLAAATAADVAAADVAAAPGAKAFGKTRVKAPKAPAKPPAQPMNDEIPDDELPDGVVEAYAEEYADQYCDGAGPMIVREKLHRSMPMTLDQALYEMELVGHDFFLFCDKESGLPSVVYRRRAYDYGVIRLETVADAASSGFDDRPLAGAARRAGDHIRPARGAVRGVELEGTEQIGSG
jgi:ribosomal subunit interface protein